jgi:S1-C subfamily serine protease
VIVQLTRLRDGSRRTTRIGIAEADDVEPETIDANDEDATPAMMEAFDGAEVTDIPEDLELRGGQDGVYISSVERGSKAARAGLQRGDIIRRVGRTNIENLDDFEEAIENGKGPYVLRVERNGQTSFLAVK